ncbi:type III restriction endonuclease subunit R [Geosporobacter ferrireducens]|uniref:Type III restriction endonuclease subunit R n=1 Tax=Geosporobacter ferrireducens TaxID=1424294 RepID=A0A1D8GQK4_9FIRM|nr:type III restriction endonuclease subunit R [Geosporobacter ferrireducens]
MRNAQIGAIHAISSFFTLHKNKAAVIVMPTGSGKTAVLMMTPYVVGSEKVLIVTPSVMVRGQIVEDYSSLKTLCRAVVFRDGVKKPTVYEMKHTYCDDMLVDINEADVVVATPLCALSLSSVENVRVKFDIILVDEAHHVPAKTWEQILVNMNAAKHVLFTATPFRLDRKEIKGEMIYTYPLSMAYSDGIFGEIEYIPIDEEPNKDYLIAKKAERVFFSDRELGYDHYLMVRTNTKEKAKELEELYSQETALSLKRIDSSMSNSTIKKCINELRNKSLDGIICVDMLGEGFDFPNLKIAAIHSPHKSLASALQFIGRFARTNAENIGTAKFIAMNDSELLIENTAMYTNDAIWQDIIIDLSENKAKEEEQSKEYFKGFRRNANSGTDANDEISLHSIRPNGHAKIYRVSGFDISASFPDACNVSEDVLINENDNTVVGIGKECIPPKWTMNDNLVNINNVLYIVHYQAKCNLLYIYSQTKTEAIYESIANAFCDSFNKIPKYQMNRVLGDLKEFEIFNSGMQNRYVESGESYRISAGSDVSAAIDPVTGKLYSPGHVFCKASSEDSEITIGYSSGSKMWSSTYFTIPQYVKWCDFNGKKIVNPDMKVKTNTNFDFLPMPMQLTKYPDNIFICDYDADTYSSPPVIKKANEEGFKNILTDICPKIVSITHGTVIVEFCFADMYEQILCDINGNYTSANPQIMLVDGREIMHLVEYLNEYPLSFKTTDDVLIQGIEYLRGNADAIVFSSDNIKGIDWDYYGTNRRIEVNDPVYHPTGISIQTTVEQLLTDDVDNKYIIYDHSSSEIADYITIKESEFTLEATLYHVKKMSAQTYNSSVDDVYEVSGQAVKSTIWLKTKPGFISKIKDRRRSGHCNFFVGDYEHFKLTMKQNKQLIGKIVIVQPSISKGKPMPDKIQQVLAATNFYINNSGKVKSLTIWGSI